MCHRKAFKNSFVKVMQKSRSAEEQIVKKPNQGVEKSRNISNSENVKRLDSYSKKVGVDDKTIVSYKLDKDAPDILYTCKNLRNRRSKPLIFSSSEMLYSNTDDSIKFDKKNTSESCFKKSGEQRKPVVDEGKEVNQGDSEALENVLKGNSCIQPLEENIDSTMKLFVSKKNGPSFSETVKNLLKIENDEKALDMACSGERRDLRGIQIDTNMRGPDTKTEFGKVEIHQGDVGKSDGVIRSTLYTKIVSGGKTDALKGPLKSSKIISKTEKSTNSTHNVQTLKRGDNVTLHRHKDLKRPIRQERVEFDTIVIEKKGKKITKIKPKHDSNLRKIKSSRSLTVNKNKIYESKTSCKPLGSSKVKSYVVAKSKDRADDILVIPEDGNNISPSEIDSVVPKMNLEILNRESVVIPEDGGKIRGECDWSTKERSKQHGDSGKQSLKSEGMVIPQDGNANRLMKTKTDSFKGESCSDRNDRGKSTGYIVGSQNDKKQHYQSGDERNDKKQHYQSGDERMYGKQNPKKTEYVALMDSQNQIQTKVSYYKPKDFKHNRNNPTFNNDFGINQHVFVQNSLKSKGMESSHSSMKDAVERKREPGNSKISPQSAAGDTTKQEVSESLTLKMSVNRISRTEEKNEIMTAPDQQRALEQVTQTFPESSLPNQNAPTAISTKNSWRSLLPFYISKSNELEKALGNRQPLHSPFPDSFTAVSKSSGVPDSRVGNQLCSRKVTKLKFNPQSESESTQGFLMSVLPGQRIKQDAEPKIAATSDTATAIVLKSRLAQNPTESFRSLPQAQPLPTAFSQSHIGISSASTTNFVVKAPDGLIPANVSTSGFQLGSIAKERAETVYPSKSSSFALGTQPVGHSFMANKTESSSVNSGINNSISGCPSDMPKASFPPPCSSCQNGSLMLTENQGCSTDGCNTKSVFPPPCNPCEPPSRHQPDNFSCPTCKPEFPPPCPPNNPCSTSQPAENRCYDPCKTVTKSKTHTVLDISNLPRPPAPICIDCVPKTKPCFPPECPQQCKNTSSTWCHNMNKTKGSNVSLASWRAFVNYSYWSMKCLLTGVFANFLTALKTRILHMSELKKKSVCQKPIHPQVCEVTQSSVIRPRKESFRSIKNRKIVNSTLQVRPRTTNKVRKKRHIVKSMKKSVLDDTKRAILAEEEKRKSVGAKAPALAYSEVLNIVFSQKK